MRLRMVQLVRLRKSRGDAAQVLEASVDRFGGAVGGAGMIEVGQDVGAPLGQGPGRLGDLLQPGRGRPASGS